MINNPNVKTVAGRYGTIFYWANDFVIGPAVATYGEWFESEVDAFRLYAKPGDTVADVGANIGMHTQALASLVGPRGRVIALEPQKPMWMLAITNAILNGYLNVELYNCAAGEDYRVVNALKPDYSRLESFGGYTIEPCEDYVTEPIHVVPLDDAFGTDKRVSLIKVDVEGGEANAIRGAVKTIQRCHPVLYVENDRVPKSKELIELLWSLGYTLYWHTPLFYNPNNFARFSGVLGLHQVAKHWDGEQYWLCGQSLNLVCVPDASYPLPAGAWEVIDSTTHPCAP